MKENLTPMIRNCARAVIIRDGAILLLCKQSPSYGTRYALPGGAQEEHETLEAALIRECQEEIGTTVAVSGLMHVADFFKSRGTSIEINKHTVEFLFSCSVPNNYAATNGPAPDKNQKNVFWLPLGELATAPLFPEDLRPLLNASAPQQPFYLGRIT
ncbi:NUDIX domain-containing protein [Thalassospira lucentensis]|uniref:NUDIX domain-containing protein n=1 Tax=Thalassospira lucentensis TaxID=168935 RepID=UPI003D2F4EED